MDFEFEHLKNLQSHANFYKKLRAMEYFLSDAFARVYKTLISISKLALLHFSWQFNRIKCQEYLGLAIPSSTVEENER